MSAVTTITAVAVYPESGLTEVLKLTRDELKQTLERLFGSPACHVHHGEVSFMAYLDDGGISRGLRPNARGSLLAGAPVFGPVLLVGLPDEAGLDTSVSAELLTLVEALDGITILTTGPSISATPGHFDRQLRSFLRPLEGGEKP